MMARVARILLAALEEAARELYYTVTDLVSAPVVCVTARPVGHGDGPRGG